MKNAFRILFLTFLLPLSGWNSLFAQWVQTGAPPHGLLSLAVSGTRLVAGSGYGGVFRSTDEGAHWTDVSIPQTNADVQAIVFSGEDLFAGLLGDVMDGYGSGAYRSTDNGTSWTAVDSGLTKPYIHALAVSGTNLFAGTEYGGAFLSTNQGTSWSAVNVGLVRRDVRVFAVSGQNIFAGTDSGVFLSTNIGARWKAVNSGLMDVSVRALALSGTNLFVLTDSSIYRTTNVGADWNKVASVLAGRPLVLAGGGSATSGMKFIVVGTHNAGVLLSTDSGTTWTGANASLTDTNIQVFGSTDSFLFAGTANGHLWFRPWQSFLTAVVERTTLSVPLQLSLEQNYPNPFNPVTSIAFSIPQSGFVSLKIVNTMGDDIVTLVSGTLAAGQYTTQWNATGFESGVYFCRVESNGIVLTRELALIK